MHDFVATLEFALSVTVPIILVLALGAYLSYRNFINDAFIATGSRLVFNVTLPVLLFLTVSQTDFSRSSSLSLILLGLVGTLIFFILLEVLAGLFIRPPRDRGVVVQGIYRGNLGIVGLAYCANAYGDVGMAIGSFYVATVTILYNVLAVITLSRSLGKDASIQGIFRQVLRNPLILGIAAGLPFAYFHIQLPSLVLHTGQYFAQMTLPLALLCTGGSLSLSGIGKDSGNLLTASIGKTLISPLLLTVAGILLGLRGMNLAILFLMSATPTAAATYVMTRAMGGNGLLAANIIGTTTVGSVIATSIGLTILKLSGLI